MGDDLKVRRGVFSRGYSSGCGVLINTGEAISISGPTEGAAAGGATSVGQGFLGNAVNKYIDTECNKQFDT